MDESTDAALMSVSNVDRIFGGGKTLTRRERPKLHALSDVTLDIRRGETLGVVGESGCGKSTLARLLVGLDRPSGGTIHFRAEDVAAAAAHKPRALARKVQFVFQDPVASLNPRKTIRAVLEAPLIHLLGLDKVAREKRLVELMDAVNLRPEFLERYPHEFSGGQAQRIGIARALAADPELIVLDEPVSALDVSVQAQVLNILDELKRGFSLTYVFISHDLSVVESVSDRVVVLYFGRIAEIGRADAIFRNPRHQYTKLLLSSAPVPGRKPAMAEDAETELPDPYHPPKGCAFAARCPRADAVCRAARPPLEPAPDGAGHLAACYHPG
ncbi:MAG TPA: oligopeptide/dipeptide ABC transporter ATP-binding protein [Pararhizobium sp.]|nr:oligopeptide/dipeptide ABC transporter ATP-binding protein [Pararhizobium sp.]